MFSVIPENCSFEIFFCYKKTCRGWVLQSGYYSQARVFRFRSLNGTTKVFVVTLQNFDSIATNNDSVRQIIQTFSPLTFQTHQGRSELMRSTAEIIISFRGSSLNRLVRQHFFESRADVLIAIKGDLLLERFGENGRVRHFFLSKTRLF